MKLQEVYISEGAMAGSWSLIGYMAPNMTSSTATTSSTTNFKYSVGEDLNGGTTAVTDLNCSLGWKAENIVALNDCAASGSGACEWDIKLSNSAGNGAAFSAVLSGATAAQLTPSFGKIGTGSCTFN